MRRPERKIRLGKQDAACDPSDDDVGAFCRRHVAEEGIKPLYRASRHGYSFPNRVFISLAIRSPDREDAARIPIVAVTANAFAEDIAKTTEAGMNGHVAKPFTVEELTDVLGKLMK